MYYYKESGIPYVGKIPKHWDLKKNKRCFLLNKKIVGQNFEDFELLSLTKKGIIYKDINNTFGKTPESYETYQSVKAGQLVMCLFDLDISAVFSGISPYDGMISPAYKVYDCKSLMYNKYAGYWFDFCFDGRKYMSYSKSLRYVVNSEDFNDISIIVPPLDEQQKIASFLDEKIKELDNAIIKTKETIEDYKKLKQSIIFNGVTKGIDYNRKFKTSDFEWIDNIPCEWKISKLKSVAKFKTGTTPSTSETKWFNGDYDWFTPGDFSDKYILKNSNRKLSIQAKIDNALTIIPANSTLLIGIGGTAGKIGYVEEECSCNQQITALIPHKVYPKYLMYWMIANTKYLKDTALYTTLPIINNDFLGNYLFIDPNDIEEEKKIVEYLDDKCNKIDKLIESKERIVEELENYKKSVIYEYVTGKKEVN